MNPKQKIYVLSNANQTICSTFHPDFAILDRNACQRLTVVDMIMHFDRVICPLKRNEKLNMFLFYEKQKRM